ncbi:MAG: hypothetical protein JWM11_709 [Planctomycetaceae bacterium]|nr:hypothetical protein [Planctomycetaceae bacterium]
MKLRLSGLSLAIMFLVVTSVSAQDNAIRDAGAKIRGDAQAGHNASMYQRHAQDRSLTLYHYSQSQQPLPKAEAKELVTGIKKDLTSADKALAKLKAEHAKEPEAMKLISAIEKHQAKAHEVCNMAEEHCLKEHGDHVVIGDCCSEMWHEIDAARADTAKLLKLLKIENLEPPKKSPVKKAVSK